MSGARRLALRSAASAGSAVVTTGCLLQSNDGIAFTAVKESVVERSMVTDRTAAANVTDLRRSDVSDGRRKQLVFELMAHGAMTPHWNYARFTSADPPTSQSSRRRRTRARQQDSLLVARPASLLRYASHSAADLLAPTLVRARSDGTIYSRSRFRPIEDMSVSLARKAIILADSARQGACTLVVLWMDIPSQTMYQIRHS
jgi:hypothetical protein